MNSTTGIGEHSDIVETIELELEQVANYHDKLEMLVKYFIQPQAKEEENVDWSLLQEFEKEDTTSGGRELACTAGVCEIVDIEAA